MSKKIEWDKSDLTEERLGEIADASASRAVVRLKKGEAPEVVRPKHKKPRRRIVRLPVVRGVRTYLGMAQYGDCGFHTFYAVGEDEVRCCAESSCEFDIDRHRAPITAA